MSKTSRQFPSSDDPKQLTTLDTTAARALFERVTAPAVTLMLPLDPSQQSGEHERLTLKNLVADARRQLEGWAQVDADSLLAGAEELIDDGEWWRGPGRGFVLLLAPDGVVEHFRLSETLTAKATVDTQFAIRDLLPALHGDEKFFVLAISQNRTQLFSGDRFGLTRSTKTLSPTSLADAMSNFEHSNDLSRHGGGQPSATGRPFEGVHGQGSARDERKSELETFFRGIDEAVLDAVGHEAVAPLVLAIDEQHLSIYKRVNNYPNMVDGIVAGNPDYLSVDDLHRRAWTIVAPRFEQERDADIARYHDSIGTARCTTSISDIVAESAAGRVAAIFVGNDRPVWGRVAADTGVASIHDERQPGDEDLVNRSVVQTLRHAGSAYGQVDLGTHTTAVLYRY